MKKAIKFFILSLSAITLFACSSTRAESEKVRVIFDTDFNYDVDDVGAVAMLHALADLDEAVILAIGISDRQ
ncbi:MAG: nucleoside hydrolase, partial [Bacteroidetes bacterium]